MGTVHKLRSSTASAKHIQYLGKTQKVTVELPTSLVRSLADMAQAKLAKYYQAHPEDRLLTQAQWASSTAEGRRFMHDCVTHKYARLSHSDLRKVTKQAYLDSIDAMPRKGPTLKDMQLEILIDALTNFNSFHKYK